MADFQNLPPNYQASVQAKLDGYLEACIHVARAHNIGLSEAMGLTVRALLREMIAHKIDPQRANHIWALTTSELFQPSERGQIAMLQ